MYLKTGTSMIVSRWQTKLTEIWLLRIFKMLQNVKKSSSVLVLQMTLVPREKAVYRSDHWLAQFHIQRKLQLQSCSKILLISIPLTRDANFATILLLSCEAFPSRKITFLTCFMSKLHINVAHDLLDVNEWSELKQNNDLRSKALRVASLLHDFVCKLAKVHGTLDHEATWAHQSRHSAESLEWLEAAVSRQFSSPQNSNSNAD